MRPPFDPGRSQRLRWWWQDLRGARCTLGLAVVLLVVEATVSSRGGPGSPQAYPLYEFFGLSSGGIGLGRFWQLFTHGLLHGGWGHLLVNLLLLVSTGARVERIGSSRTVAKVFAAGTVAGGTAFLLLPAGNLLLVGASGGIFALLLWLTTVSPESRMAPIPISASNLGLGILIASGALAVAALWLPPGELPISHACHFGGALAGWLMARWQMRIPRIPVRR